MTVFEAIKGRGGFLDCGMIGSMPLGYFMNGEIMSTGQYYEARRLISEKKLKKVGETTNQDFPTYLTMNLRKGDLYKVK